MKIRTLNKEMVKSALLKNKGLYTLTARDLKICRNTLFKYLKDNPDLQNYIDEITEGTLDEAEAVLIQLIKKRDLRAIMYFLNAKGINRGYGNNINEKIKIKQEVLEEIKQELLHNPTLLKKLMS